jgi:hypothetical protein
VTNNNMVNVLHPPYSPYLAPMISLCFPNWKRNWWDNVLKQYSTALRKMTSTLLFKRE